ncbi:MAG: oxygen-independent coproporphyrinogen III oxidase, partial [Pseudomonadota bacterium]
PRYTSYPTAPHFNMSVGAEDMTRWLARVPNESAVSLYIHIPFCRRLCWFCACRTQGTRNIETVRAYLEVLKAEISLLKERLPKDIRLSRLHWGGGTPTLLTPEMIFDLAEAQSQLGPLLPDGEFSVEIDPNEIDDARLDALVEVGLTRASIGVQDFNPEIQRQIGRVQSYETTRDVVEAIRSRGIESLNADILYGLPSQTPQRLSDSVQRLLSLTPDRVALYGYAHVPWMSRRQSMIPSDLLPEPEERLRLFDTARRLFLWDGYHEIGIDHFARPQDSLALAAKNGSLRRNFQGYTDDETPILIGLGASAISRFPWGYAQNAAATRDYVTAISDGQFATARGYQFCAEDLLRARLIEQIMCSFEIDIPAIRQDFGLGRDDLTPLLTEVSNQFPGAISLTDIRFAIRPEGRPLTRMIARAFDTFELSKSGHSAAI